MTDANKRLLAGQARSIVLTGATGKDLEEMIVLALELAHIGGRIERGMEELNTVVKNLAETNGEKVGA